MFDPTFGWLVASPITWIDLFLSLCVIGGLITLVVMFVRRKIIIIFTSAVCAACFLSWFFSLNLVWGLSLVLLAIFAIVVLFVNIAEIRPYLSTNLTGGRKLRTSTRVYDRKEVIRVVSEAVKDLANSMTGAIITFEKNDVLIADTSINKMTINDNEGIGDKGTILDAPINKNLLLTIFYKGTALHDGAVIIRRDKILSAASFYKPTEHLLNGKKYGSRHRAAIGISEYNDSVTVVVSEETGSVSITHRGSIVASSPMSIYNDLCDFLIDDEANTNKAKEQK